MLKILKNKFIYFNHKIKNKVNMFFINVLINKTYLFFIFHIPIPYKYSGFFIFIQKEGFNKRNLLLNKTIKSNIRVFSKSII